MGGTSINKLRFFHTLLNQSCLHSNSIKLLRKERERERGDGDMKGDSSILIQ